MSRTYDENFEIGPIIPQADCRPSEGPHYYDWDNGLSSDPQWLLYCEGCKVIDVETGEEVRRVLFCDMANDDLIRLPEPVTTTTSNDLARICEKRKVKIVARETPHWRWGEAEHNGLDAPMCSKCGRATHQDAMEEHEKKCWGIS